MFEMIKNLICDFSETEPNKITTESVLRKDLSLNSLDMVNLAVAIEDETGINVSDKDMATFFTVGDLVRFVEQ